VLIQARKGARGPLRLVPGLALHDQSGSFSPKVEDVLRHGKALVDLSEGWRHG
jgi:tRNA1(Val) A37 N6-methylase TrmN6